MQARRRTNSPWRSRSDGTRRREAGRNTTRHGTARHGTARHASMMRMHDSELVCFVTPAAASPTPARRSARTRVLATTSAAPRNVVTSSRRHVALVARPHRHHRRRHQHQHRPSRAPQSATSAPTMRHGLDAANARETGPDRGHQAQSAARRRTRAATPHVAPRIDRRTDRRAPLEIALAAPIFETLTQPHPRAACFDRYVTATRTDRHACPRVRRPRSRRTRP